jgi:hypothetical protein
VSLKSGDFVTRHSGQPGDSQREPESREFRDFWIPAFAGMTTGGLPVM